MELVAIQCECGNKFFIVYAPGVFKCGECGQEGEVAFDE